MAWQGRQLPGNWGTLRLRRFELDDWTCQHPGCTYRNEAGIELECDHVGAPDDHRIETLRTKCTPHHAEHTDQQRRAALAAQPRTRRPAEPHPGLR